VDQLLTDQDGKSNQLKQALDDLNSRVRTNNEDIDPARREATIMGDREIPYRLLKKVMATCSEAGFGRISLAVLQKSLQEG
jgi:biopolymer transport protein ExbD